RASVTVATPPIGIRVREHIRESVRQTLNEESRRNELLFAYARLGFLAPTALLACVVDIYLYPGALPQSWIDDLALSLFAVASLAVVLVLRRNQYHPAVRFVIPIADA